MSHGHGITGKCGRCYLHPSLQIENKHVPLPRIPVSIGIPKQKPSSQQATAAEYDREAAEQYRKEIEARITCLEFEAARLTGKDNKKERSAKGRVKDVYVILGYFRIF